MATTKDVSLKIAVDGEKEYKKAIAEVVASSKSLASEMDLLVSSFDKSTSAEEKSLQKKKILADQIANQNKLVEKYEEMVTRTAQKTGENSVETERYRTALNKAKTELNKMNNEFATMDDKIDVVTESTKKFELSMKDLVTADLIVEGIKRIASAITETAKAALAYNANIESYTAALSGFVGGMENAANVVDRIKESSKTSIFDANALINANKYLITAGESADDAFTAIQALSGAIAATGGSSDALERMAQNLQQIKNVGKASSVDIKQFAQAGINVYGLLADYMGITAEEASKLSVTYEDLVGALKLATSETGAYAGATDNLINTYSVQMSMLKANIQEGWGKAFQGLSTALGSKVLPVLNKITTGLSDMSISGEEAVVAISDMLANVMDGITDKLPEFMENGSQIMTSIVDGFVKGFPRITEAMAKMIGEFAKGIASNAGQIVANGMKMIMAIVDGINAALPQLIDALPGIVEGFIEGISSHFTEILALGITIVLKLLDGMLKAMPQILLAFANLGTDIIAKLAEVDWKGIGMKIVQRICDGIKSLASSIWSAIIGGASGGSSGGGGDHGGGGMQLGSNTINVYGTEGSDSQSIADEVMYRLNGREAAWA